MNAAPLLHDRYRLIRQLGAGGFATTHLAEDTRTGETCVVKELRLTGADDWKAIELFEREGRILANLDHPQIPRFIDYFTIDEPADRRYCLVQTWVEGQNLAELVAAGRRFSAVEVARIAVAVLDVLIYLHGLQPPVIHRDIKPSNLILSPDGRPYLIDFGSVRDSLMQDHQTKGGGSTIVGTYGYMPFEQFSGRALPASDLYALGATLLFMLSHQHPSAFEQDDRQINYRSAVSVSDGMAQILDRMVAFQWQQRFQSADEAKRALQALLAGAPATAPKRRPWRQALIAGVLAAVGIVGALVLWPQSFKPDSGDVRIQEASERTRQGSVAADDSLSPDATVVGEILWDGQLLSTVTKERPTFWFRHETSGRQTEGRARYHDGAFTIEGLPLGKIGMSNFVDDNPANPSGYPGDYNGWTTFERQAGRTVVAAHVAKVIHLTAPFDNDRPIPGWNSECHEEAIAHSPVPVAWEPVADGLWYEYTVKRVVCPYKSQEVVISDRTQGLSVALDLPPSRPGEFYELSLSGNRGDDRVGTMLTHGKGGLGWDVRFRVE